MKQRYRMGNWISLILILICCHLTHGGVYDTLSSWYCNAYECCNENHVPYNLKNLKYTISTKLKGQHIAKDIVLHAITSHMHKSKKPLVMSFHGPNGVGKTYLTRMIAQAFFEKGENSRFFNFYYGLQDFPDKRKVLDYQAQLKSNIDTALQNCERSLFVFDGVDQMPQQLLNVLMPYIDCTNCAGNLKKHKSIFIFLSNTASSVLVKELQKKMKEGIPRESTTLQDFQKLIIDTSRDQSGGLFESELIKSDAITYYVPFLPLQREHVEYCIKEAFEDVNISSTKVLINEVFAELRFGPEPENLFSTSGCKRVSQIAGRISAKLYINFDVFDEVDSYRSEL